MAKEFRFFKIGEANAEIARLETELATAKAQADAAAGNDSEVADQASLLKSEADSLKQQIAARDATISTLTKERDEARAEAAKAKQDAEAHCKDFDAKVKAEASKEAQKITAGQGIPPVAQTPANTPAGEPKVELKGLERVRAAFAAQIKQ